MIALLVSAPLHCFHCYIATQNCFPELLPRIPSQNCFPEFKQRYQKLQAIQHAQRSLHPNALPCLKRQLKRQLNSLPRLLPRIASQKHYIPHSAYFGVDAGIMAVIHPNALPCLKRQLKRQLNLLPRLLPNCGIPLLLAS